MKMSNFNFDFDATADEDFFGSLKSKSSKLQQLLDEDTLPEAEKQQSLKYQRPKANDLKNTNKNEIAPSSSAASSNSGASTTTLLAKVVTAYRQRQLQGKVGMALVKTAGDSLQVVMYKSKEMVLATLQLHNDRQCLFKQERYWQFYDDTTEVDWSFCFDNQEDDIEFQNLLLKNQQTFQHSEKVKMEKERSESDKDKGLIPLSDEDSTNTLSKPIGIAESNKSKVTSKTSLIKRMAKMGQPLPNLSTSSMQTTTEFSDSSDTEVIQTPLSLPQKPSIAPRSSKLTTLKNNHTQLIPSSLALNATPVYSTISNNLESQYMQMLLTEQRTQGSELRMNVQKLETKIEKVLDKLDNFEGGAKLETKHKHRDDEILELEEKILNLKKENRKLKQNIEDLRNNESYEDKIKGILANLKEDLEELNIDEDNDLEKIIKQCVKKQRNSQEASEKQQQLIDYMEKIKNEVENNLVILKESHTTLENELQVLKETNLLYKSDMEEKDKLLKSLEQQIQNLQEDLKQKSNDQPHSSTDLLVKNIMNNLFADICSKIASCGCSDKENVLSLVGLSIKQQTLKALKEQMSGEAGH